MSRKLSPAVRANLKEMIFKGPVAGSHFLTALLDLDDADEEIESLKAELKEKDAALVDIANILGANGCSKSAELIHKLLAVWRK